MALLKYTKYNFVTYTNSTSKNHEQGSFYELNTYYLNPPFQRHLLFKCHRNGRQLSQKWKGIVWKSVLPATINCSPHGPHSHTLTLGVISLRVWEAQWGRIHYIKSPSNALVTFLLIGRDSNNCITKIQILIENYSSIFGTALINLKNFF